jgi:hypothetical protein
MLKAFYQKHLVEKQQSEPRQEEVKEDQEMKDESTVQPLQVAQPEPAPQTVT